MKAVDKYQALMTVIRNRFDYIHAIQSLDIDPFFAAETAAFHGRKIVEGIAFGCLVALENGIKEVPRDAKGKYKAGEIFMALKKKKLDVFPSPSIIRLPTAQEIVELVPLKAVLEGQLDRRVTIEELTAIYARLHKWNHELNPYTYTNRIEFGDRNRPILWDDLARLERFIDRHVISIQGEAFFCVLRDKMDGQTKVGSLTKIAELPLTSA